MAQLKDTVVYGNLRVTDSTLTDILQVTAIKAPSTSGGTAYSVGANNQALMSNGTSTYWGTPVGTTYSAGTGLSLSGTTFNHSNSVTAVTTAGMLKVKYDAQGHITGSSAFAQADVSTLINLLGTGASNPELADYYIAQYAGGGTTTTTYHRRPVSALWNTLKALITVSTTGDGNAITSVSIGNDGNNRKLTFTKGSTFSNVAASTNNGKIKIDGTDTTVYTHPSHTSKSSGLYKITVDSLGHVSATAAVAKGDIPALDYIPTSVSYAEGDVVGGGPGAAKTLVNAYCETTGGTYYPIAATAMTSTAEPTKTIANLGKRLSVSNSVGDDSNAITLILGRSSSGNIAAVTGYLELYNSNGGQARITPTSSSTGLNTLRLPASDGTLITSEEVAAGYVPLTGSTDMSGIFQANGNSAAFAVVNADSDRRLGLHIGSGGKNRGLYDWGGSTYTAGVGDWVFRIDAENRVGIRATLLESSTANNGMPIPVLGGTPETATKNIYNSDGFRINLQSGTTSAAGKAELVLGNSKGSTTEGNKQGQLSIYSTSTSYHRIQAASTSTSKTWTLPAIPGITVNGSASHTNVFAANRYSIIYDDTSHASTPWYKFAEITITTTYEDHIITFLVSNGWCDSSQTVGGMTGILTAHVRTGSAKTHDSANSNAAMELKWNLACSNINPEDYVMVYTDTANTSCKVELWCKMAKQYDSRIFQVLKEHKRREIGTYWTLIRNDGRARAANYTTGTGTVTSSLCTIKNPTA